MKAARKPMTFAKKPKHDERDITTRELLLGNDGKIKLTLQRYFKHLLKRLAESNGVPFGR